MRMFPILLSLLLASGEPMCGTHPANDARVLAIHERTRQRIASLAVDPSRAATLREGAFYVENDETITPGHRGFDLHGQTLVFTPSGSAAFTVRREALQYVEPAGDPVRDFRQFGGENGHFVAHDLPFAFPLFGTSVTRIYLDAFNGIRTSNPRVQRGTQLDALQAGVHRGPLLSPLMVTADSRSPRPLMWIDQQPDAVIITWRGGDENTPFAFDVQAKLAQDGTVAYSYRSVVAMHWGAPMLSPGLDPATVSRTTLHTAPDKENDARSSVREELQAMLDVQRFDVQRLADSDLFAIRITLGAPIDRTRLLDGEVLEYEVRLSGLEVAVFRIKRDSTEVFPFGSRYWDTAGEPAHFDGNVVEIYAVQGSYTSKSVRVATYSGMHGLIDSVSTDMTFTPAPRSLVTDLSAVAQDARLDVPIVEPFVLGSFDPWRVWDVVQTAYGLSDHDVDAVAMYQSFYTDLMLYAGAYATGGNPQADGIHPFSPFYGTHATKKPTLLHMNQLTYGYQRAEASASQVLLHEFGHRWLYFFSIANQHGPPNVLNPVSAHPAAYVHTAAAFPVYGEHESSVMGGGYFTQQQDGSWIARASNMGYSWTDLYLMGLAAPEEVPPWFYLAGTWLSPAYWPPDGAVVTGEKHEVKVGQITAVHGPRIPSVVYSQRLFRVLFVLVTENGEPPTDAEVAKLNEWRRVMERNFALATGGRGRLVTTFVRPGKRRVM